MATTTTSPSPMGGPDTKFVADKFNSVHMYVMTVRSKNYIGRLLGNQQEVGHIGMNDGTPPKVRRRQI